MSLESNLVSLSLIDAKLTHNVFQALSSLDSPEARVLAIGAHMGIVTLSGRLRLISTKRAVLEKVRKVAGVRIVIDNVVVGADVSSWRARYASNLQGAIVRRRASEKTAGSKSASLPPLALGAVSAQNIDLANSA
jgi:hypothetical protein